MPLIVVAAAMVAPDGRVLIQQRPMGTHHGGLWEFPGGKCEAGERAAAALARELAEELTIDVDPADLAPLGFAVEARAQFATTQGRDLILLLFACRRWRGDVQPLSAMALNWVDPAAVVDYPMPPADVHLARKLPGWLSLTA